MLVSLFRNVLPTINCQLNLKLFLKSSHATGLNLCKNFNFVSQICTTHFIHATRNRLQNGRMDKYILLLKIEYIY